MDGLGPQLAGRGNYRLDAQITPGRGSRADGVSRVGQTHVQRARVGLREDRDRADPQFTAGADNADGDFAAVGNQDAGEHLG